MTPCVPMEHRPTTLSHFCLCFFHIFEATFLWYLVINQAESSTYVEQLPCFLLGFFGGLFFSWVERVSYPGVCG